MIGPVAPPARDTQERQARQNKLQAKPHAWPSQHPEDTDEFYDTVQLSPEALAAAHDGEVNHDR